MPTLATYQTNGMNTLNGLRPSLNSNGQIGLIAWTPKIVAKTAAYTVTAKESGTIFTTTGAGGSVTFTLPAISTGPFIFRFLCGAAQTVVVAAATADTMVGFNDLEADSVSIAQANEKVGGSILVVCDGTTLFGLNCLTNAGQTLTVTS